MLAGSDEVVVKVVVACRFFGDSAVLELVCGLVFRAKSGAGSLSKVCTKGAKLLGLIFIDLVSSYSSFKRMSLEAWADSNDLPFEQ